MALFWPYKDPDEVLDYSINWADRLDVDTISTSVWMLAANTPDANLAFGVNSYSNTATVIWLSGGTLGKDYHVTNRITTAAGRTMDQSVKIKIRHK